MDTKLPNNTLAFIALCNEYCAAVENAAQSTMPELIASITRILPRLYISASDLVSPVPTDESTYLNPALDEDYYDSIRRQLEAVFGADDTYLEVFENDMKYSDTPIGASISENLTDIFQSCYNFVEMIKDAPEPIVDEALAAMKEDFQTYWSAILCNVMRPLNQLLYSNDQQFD